MKEREINLVDLLVEILLHWRMFIILMLTGAVLLGAYSFIRSQNTTEDQQLQTLQPEEWLSEEEMQNVNLITAYEEMYLAMHTYQKESPLMKLDPNHVCTAEATIAISAADPLSSYNIEKVYEDIMLSSELITKVAENTGINATGLNELILLTRSVTLSDSLAAENDVAAEKNDTKTFRIIVKYGDEVQCQKILDAVIAFLKENQPTIESSLGQHEISIVNESLGVVSDSAIAEKQKIYLNNITTMKKTVSDAIAGLSDTEQQYYDMLINAEETEGTVEPGTISAQRISIKYVLLGAVMAAFLYVCFLSILFIFNTKIRSTENLQELYDIPQLGMIPAEKNYKKLLGSVDKWFISLRDRNKRQFTSDEALELASVAIKMSAGKEMLHQISLIGCGLKTRSLDACEKIKTQLAKDDIQVSILNNVLYDAQMMEELEGAKGVVLVESAGSTLYNEIAEELELLNRQGITVLGGILVE